MDMGDRASMDGMDMSPGACKISMFWNWSTVGACFISDTWQIQSSGIFAGSCIGVICLVMSLELLRRLSREYENWITQQNHAHQGLSATTKAVAFAVNPQATRDPEEIDLFKDGNHTVVTDTMNLCPSNQRTITEFLQQIGRASLHMLQFGVAYFIMLLAMYYNGYFIICIMIGAFLGSFAFSWDMTSSSKSDSGEVTYCCG